MKIHCIRNVTAPKKMAKWQKVRNVQFKGIGGRGKHPFKKFNLILYSFS